jgi:hypothetical protein
MITHNELLETFSYADGQLYWKITTGSGKIRPGTLAGCTRNDGYWVIVYKRKHYFAHRLIWFYHHGVWPTNSTDHIDRDRLNNRIENLRECTYAENAQNRSISKRNKSGHTGVRFHDFSGKWAAYVRFQGKLNITYHLTMEEAIEARRLMKANFHKFHPDPVLS